MTNTPETRMTATTENVSAILTTTRAEMEKAKAHCAALAGALDKFVIAAKSWHDFHHGSKTVQCDWLCECIAPGESALSNYRQAMGREG